MKNLDELSWQGGPTRHYESKPSKVKQRGFYQRMGQNMFSGARIGRLEVTLPNGQLLIQEGEFKGPQASIHFKNWNSILKYKFGGDLAFAEGYMAGDIDIHDLKALFNWYLENDKTLADKVKPNVLVDGINKFIHRIVNNNNMAGSKKNISYHYDLGNDFYRLWLDETMTYSSADFSSTDDLVKGQIAKYARMAKYAGVNEGKCVLEIGCGWGGFSEYVLSHFHNISYKGVTISREQLSYAKGRLKNINKDPNTLCFEDYRDIEGTYDAIVSVEMFEAVGEKHWDTYFNAIKKLLSKDGKATIQVITIEHERYLSYRKNVDFIQKYIFPGGMLPSKEIFVEKAAEAGLEVVDTYAFGKSYAETLRRWKQAFVTHWALLKKQGFDDRFYRMWLYYLVYCEVGFDAKTTDVVQFTLIHKGDK